MSKVIFGDVVTRANTKEDRFNTDKIYYVGGEHIDSNEVLIEKRGLIAGSTIGPMFYFGFKKGDILFVSRNPHLRKAGMVTFDGICSEKTFVLESKDESVLLQRYLAFVMQSDHFWAFMEAHKSGSVNYFINWSTLAKYEFELPDIATQRRLSDILWAINKSKHANLELIEATNGLVKSQFIERFGDPIDNEHGWKYCKFPEVTTIVLGSTPRTNNEAYWDGDIKWISPAELSDDSFYVYDTVKHITEEGVKSAGLKSFPAETVLFSTRAPIGKTAIAGCEMYCNQGFKNFICGPELKPVYLYYLLSLKKEYFQGLGTGTTFKELSRGAIEKIAIAVPPLELQMQFEELYRQSDKSKFELQQTNAYLDELTRSILFENFR